MAFINLASLIFKQMCSVASHLYHASVSVALWPFNTMYSLFGRIVDYLLFQVKSTTQKVLCILLTCLTTISLSVFFYAAFLHLYMPTAEISRPVHLAFSVCSSGHGICSFPTANVSFMSKDGIRQEILGAGQVYRVVIDLDVPDTPANRDLGMFLVVLQMYDRLGYISAESRRPAMIKYKSLVIRMVDVFLLSPFYFFGLMEEKQILSVELFSHYIDNYYHPSVGARIEIQSHNIQFYSAYLKFFANFTGLKYILYYWPFVSAICGVFFNIMLITTLMIVALYKRIQTFRTISQTLNLEAERSRQGNEGHVELTDQQVSGREIQEGGDSLKEKGTQTSTSDAEIHDIPLIQEPLDFLDDEHGAETEFESTLLSAVRHRRVN